MTPARVLIDAGGEETLEALASFVEDPDGGVARARQLARDLEQPREHGLRIQLRDQRPADVQQTPQARLIHEFVLVGRSRP